MDFVDAMGEIGITLATYWHRPAASVYLPVTPNRPAPSTFPAPCSASLLLSAFTCFYRLGQTRKLGCFAKARLSFCILFFFLFVR